MTETPTPRAARAGLTELHRLTAACEQAARRLYQAELALHDAHQSRVDAWIGAAGDRLHEAVVQHKAALAALADGRATVRSSGVVVARAA